ncbi:MAG TPA: CHASE2 domain-containing protein [Burkholderiales bacterium]|nr:CHASE2 domain-containing protein [Burkholderiales bacterium]
MSEPPEEQGVARRPRLTGGVGGMVILLLFLVLSFLPLGEQLRLLVFDGYQTLWPREHKTAPAVIVEIDDASLVAHGQWPWPRSLLAELIRKIGAARPAGIALDLILPEPDRYSPAEYARSVGLPEALARALSLLPDNDQRLAAAVAAQRVVVGVTGLNYGDPRFPNPPSVAPVRIEAGLDPQLPRFTGVLKNRPVIDRAAAGRGLLNTQSSDRIVRRIPLLANVKDAITPTLALELWRVAMGSPLLRLSSGDHGLLQVSFADRNVPTQADGSFWLYASRSARDRFVSASEVLAGRVDPAKLESKLVVIGVTGLALVDRRVTPLREEVPGVELHAQIIEQIYDNNYLVRSSAAPWLERLLLVAGCALLILWVPRLRSREAVAVALLLLVVEALIGAVAFRASGLLLDIATPMLATLATFIVMLAATLEQAEQQRRLLRDAATRVAGELSAARRIQSGLLADPAIVFRGERAFDIDAFLEPAQTVGGDFYECIKLDQRRLLFAVGDVSGKGMAAALFMALTKAILKATALRADGDVSGIVGRAASEIALENPESMFVTLFVGILDLVTGTVEYCNAGHEPPFVGGAGRPLERFPIAEGPPLCVVDDFPYETHYRELAPGEWIFVLSDGVTEATNAQGDLFGAARVEAALASALDASRAPDVLAQMHARVAAFVGDAPKADDLTLLVLRWVGPISAIPIEDEEVDLADVDLDAPVARLGDVVGGRH